MSFPASCLVATLFGHEFSDLCCSDPRIFLGFVLLSCQLPDFFALISLVSSLGNFWLCLLLIYQMFLDPVALFPVASRSCCSLPKCFWTLFLIFPLFLDYVPHYLTVSESCCSFLLFPDPVVNFPIVSGLGSSSPIFFWILLHTFQSCC